MKYAIYILSIALLLACSSRNPSDGGPVTEQPHPDLSRLVGTWLVVQVWDGGVVGPQNPLPDDSTIYVFRGDETFTTTRNDTMIANGAFDFQDVTNLCVSGQTIEALQLEGFPPNQYSFRGNDSLQFDACSTFPVGLLLTRQ